MVAVTLLGAATFDTASGTKTVTATPAVGDLIVIVTAHSGNTSAATPTDNNSAGAYTRVNSSVKATSADTLGIHIRTALIAAASSTIFTHAPGASSGGGLAVFKVTGMTKTGAAAALQSAIQSNQAAAGTPATVFGAAAKTLNAIIGAVFNATNPATMTPPTSFTERNDSGYATPTTGLETVSRDSGHTSTTVTWGGTSASAFCSLSIELDATVTQPYGQANETDTALALVGKQIGTVGRADKTSVALAPPAKMIGVIGRADKTSVALAPPALQIGTIGRADETDTAFALQQPASVGRADETDTAFAPPAVQVGTVGRADQVATAFAPPAIQVGTVGRADETDTALPPPGVQLAPIGRADEIDTALPPPGVQLAPIGRSDEIDTALPPPGVQVGTVGRADETDTALPPPGIQIGTVGSADETDTAFALLLPPSYGRADETDTALAPPGVQRGNIGRADEIDTASALTGAHTSPYGMSSETDTASALIGRQIASVGSADEIDTAFALSDVLTASYGRADEIDTAVAPPNWQPGFNSFEISGEDGRPIVLYLFQHGNSYWRYNTSDQDITIGLDQNNLPAVWLATAISDEGVTQGGSDQNDLQLTMPSNLPVPLLFRIGHPTGKVWLYVRRYHLGDPREETPLAWMGTVSNSVMVDRATARISGRSLAGTYDRNGLRLAWDRSCPHVLYGNGCRVNKALHAYPRVIGTMDAVSFTCTAHAEPDEGSFSGGFLEWLRVDGSLDRRGIERQDGNDFRVLGLTNGLTVGMNVTLYPGCARTTAACILFDNLPNYGGFPHLPGKSPFDGSPVF